LPQKPFGTFWRAGKPANSKREEKGASEFALRNLTIYRTPLAGQRVFMIGSTISPAPPASQQLSDIAVRVSGE